MKAKNNLRDILFKSIGMSMFKKIFLAVVAFLTLSTASLPANANGFECSSSSNDCPFDTPDSTFGIIGLGAVMLPHLLMRGGLDRFELRPVIAIGNNGYASADFSARTYFSTAKDWLLFSKLNIQRLSKEKLSNINGALGGGYSFHPSSQITITTNLAALSEKYSSIDEIRTAPALVLDIENRVNDYRGFIGGGEFVAHKYPWWNMYAGMKFYLKNKTGLTALAIQVGLKKDHLLEEDYTYIGIGF